MEISSVLGFPSTLAIDAVERSAEGLTISLHATTSTVFCPKCGTAGSRIHSRYTRTVSDLACVGQHLILKLLVRKWVCPLDSCPQRIFAEPFVGVVRRYARMTDRLIKALQSIGVTTNGADGANLASSLALPTTAKTLIRRVLSLPLPQEGSVPIVGIDEWAWKKGSQYGTILVDLQQRRIAALLPERSAETSTAWFKKHSEIKIVSRDRGKIFRAAADAGAPQAKQIVDRFHLQKNFGEALEKFFGHHKSLLKKVAQKLAGKAPPVPLPPAAMRAEAEREKHHAQRVARHKQIWELARSGRRKEEIAQILGISPRSVYRALEQEEPPAHQQWHRRHHVIDPYLSYLSKRWNEGCHIALELYNEVVSQGYTGSLRTIERIVAQLRPHGDEPVTKRAITMARSAPSARNTALMIIRPESKRTANQKAFLEQLCKSDPTAAMACNLAQAFSSLLHKLEGKEGLEKWKAAVQASGIPELITFVEGLADDAEAVINGCTESWNNGMVEGFVNKVKWIKRSSYGQAGFPLLQRRVLLRLGALGPLGKKQRRHSPQKAAAPPNPEGSGDRSSPLDMGAAIPA